MIDFLESWIPAHKKASAKRDWDVFWPRFFAAWFLDFPETDIEVEGQVPIRKVSVLVLILQVHWLTHTSQRIKTWFSNHSSKADASGTIVKGKGRNLLKQKRALSLAQQYMVTFKKDFEPAFAKRWEVFKKTIAEKDRHRYIASFRQKVARELYDAAPAAVRLRVIEERDKAKGPAEAAAAAADDEETSDDDEESQEMDEAQKAAKAAAQAEKKLKDDQEAAAYYQK